MMMIGLVLLLGIATSRMPASNAAPSKGDGELAAAGIAFALPSNFERVSHDPPLILSAISRRLATEQARVSLFIVPTAPDSTDSTQALIDARKVACEIDRAVYSADPVTNAPPDMPTLRVNLAGTITVLTVRKIEERYLGMVISIASERNDSDEAPLLDAFRAAKVATDPYPVEAGRSLSSLTLGVRIDLPYEYEGDYDYVLPSTSGTAVFAPTWHLALKAKLEFSVASVDLDLPLEAAAKNLRDRFMKEVALTTLTSFEPFASGLPAIRIGFLRGASAFDLLVFETDRRRFTLLASCEKTRAASMEPAITRCFASVAKVARSLRPELQDEFTDVEAGFSFRPPLMFESAGPGDGIVTYREIDVKPPEARLAVLLAEENVARPEGKDQIVDRALARRSKVLKTLSNSGWRAAGEPSTTNYGGEIAARYAIEQPMDSGVLRSERTLVFGRTRTYEIAATALASEFAILGQLFDASIATFHTAARVLSFSLGPATKSEDGSVEVSIPEDWRRVDGPSDRLAFEPISGGIGIRFDAGSAKLPPEAPLVGIAERYRSAIEAEIGASGATNVRVEETTPLLGQTKSYAYRIAYSIGKTPFRELRVAIFDPSQVTFAAARCPDDLFATWREALSASVHSVRRSGH